MLPYKAEHTSDTKDGAEVGLSSEDEAEGLPLSPGIAYWGPAAAPAAPASAAPVSAGGDEVVVKKRALKRVKQQVSTLLRGEDLPEGAQAREVAEVPYQLPPVPREATECPICQQKYNTHHRLMCHMGVHRGEKFPCENCGKVLATRRMLRAHVSACVQGKRVACTDCDKPLLQLKAWDSTTRPSMGQMHQREMRASSALIAPSPSQ